MTWDGPACKKEQSAPLQLQDSLQKHQVGHMTMTAAVVPRKVMEQADEHVPV